MQDPKIEVITMPAKIDLRELKKQQMCKKLDVDPRIPSVTIFEGDYRKLIEELNKHNKPKIDPAGTGIAPFFNKPIKPLLDIFPLLGDNPIYQIFPLLGDNPIYQEAIKVGICINNDKVPEFTFGNSPIGPEAVQTGFTPFL